MKKLIVITIILTGAFQSKAKVTNEHSICNHTFIIQTLHTLPSDRDVISVHGLSLQNLSVKAIVRPLLKRNHTNNKKTYDSCIPGIKPVREFANRFKSLFWYAGRKIYA